MSMELLSRLDKLQKQLIDNQIDVAFLYTEVNRFYFTGLKTSNGLLLVQPGQRPIFYTDFRYLEVAQKTLSSFIDVRKFKKNDPQLADYVAMGQAWKTVAYEPTITVAQYLPLHDKLADKKWVSIADIVTRLRGIKSQSEIDAIRISAAANDQALKELLDIVKPGMSELEIEHSFKKIVCEHGWGLSFDPICCAGINAVECHHHPDGSILQPESELLLDLGVTAGDYLSDMTRTVYFGTPTKRFTEIFDLVLAANQAVIAAIQPGKTCGEMDSIARKVIGDAGYGQYFDHGLGHSVGLEIHESPNLSTGSTVVLEPGMVVTVEPGVYISGDVGVRIEDLVCVTETGCKVLSHTPHQIIL